MEHQLPRHQLMLQLESMEKLLAYLEMKERKQPYLPACIQPHPAARRSITEESEGAEQAGDTDATRHEHARYGLKELNEDTEPAGYDQYLGYALGTNDATCACQLRSSQGLNPSVVPDARCLTLLARSAEQSKINTLSSSSTSPSSIPSPNDSRTALGPPVLNQS